MADKRFAEEQTISTLREAEAGAKVQDIYRKYGVSDATYYRWEAKYTRLTMSELKRLKALEQEIRRLKQIVADQMLDNRVFKELLAKDFSCPGEEASGITCRGHLGLKYQVSLPPGRPVTCHLWLPAEGQR